MYKCGKCGGSFAEFETPGQCPLCGGYSTGVRCNSCQYTGHMNEFIKNRNRCPQCGARVDVPGRSGSKISIGWIVAIVIIAIAIAIYYFYFR